MSPKTMAPILAPLLAVILAGCGGAQEAGTTPEPDPVPDAEPADITGPPEPWAEMTFDEKKQYMGEKVLPIMQDLFAHYDQGEYADFSCDTCHGEDMQERAFEMPSPSLPALYPTGTEEQRQMVEEHPEMVRFMFNDVLPTMQTLLGAEAFDEATQTGFSCYACHPSAVEMETADPVVEPEEGGAVEEADTELAE